MKHDDLALQGGISACAHHLTASLKSHMGGHGHFGGNSEVQACRESVSLSTCGQPHMLPHGLVACATLPASPEVTEQLTKREIPSARAVAARSTQKGSPITLSYDHLRGGFRLPAGYAPCGSRSTQTGRASMPDARVGAQS